MGPATSCSCCLKRLQPQVPAASSSCCLKLLPSQVPASIASPWWGTMGVCPLSLGTQIISSFPNLLSPFVTATREVRNAAMALSRLSPELSASSRMTSRDCQGRQVPTAVPRGCSHGDRCSQQVKGGWKEKPWATIRMSTCRTDWAFLAVWNCWRYRPYRLESI